MPRENSDIVAGGDEQTSCDEANSTARKTNAIQEITTGLHEPGPRRQIRPRATSAIGGSNPIAASHETFERLRRPRK